MVKNGHLRNLSTLPDAPAEKSGERLWFAVYTTCRHEKAVARHFDKRSVEHFLPVYRSQRRWRDGSRVNLDLPLFPGYIFARIQRSERICVLEVPGVLWIVGSGGTRPTPLPEFEIETLRAALDPCRVEPFPSLAAGQHVRIRSGAFTGLQGIVVRQKNTCRVVITLELIMQSIAIEVSADELEPVHADRGELNSLAQSELQAGSSA